MNKLLLVITACVCCLPSKSLAQNKTKPDSSTLVKQPVYVTSRLVTEKPLIDGKLDDECWKHGTWAGDYTQFVPDEGAKPSYPTQHNIQYDDKNLYVAFRAFDGEPDKIVRMAGVRDDAAGDVVGITFDSYRDYRTGFEFTITAWGQKVDLVLFNPMNWDFNWNAVWTGKVGMEDSAWVAELEIPLNQLRYSNKDEQVWGMHTWRWISRFSEESNWEKQSKTGPGMLYNFGELRGIKGLKRSRRLEIMPFALGGVKTMDEVQGNPFTRNGRSWTGNAGLDAKIGISSNFTVDLTINPDFGQVESDPSVMNLTAYETFYEEKRPFFLEGLTIFDYKFDDQSLFYSRRIGHAPSLVINPDQNTFVSSPDKTTILSAVKFSGTTSTGLSVGLIQSITSAQYARISDLYENRTTAMVEPMSSYTVARVQKGYNSGNTTIGGMFTSTNRMIDDASLEFLSNNAFTGGLDLLHHMKDKEFFVDARLTGSYIDGSALSIRRLQENSAHYFQRPGMSYMKYDTTRTSLSGYGGKLRIGKGSKGFWRYSTGVTMFSPGLDLNDLGYMQKADEVNQSNEIGYLINKPVSIFHAYTITLEQFNSWNFGGTYLGSGAHLNFNSEFINNWRFDGNLIFHSGAIDPGILRGGPDMILPYTIMTFANLNSDQSKKVTAGFNFRYETRGENSMKSFQVEPTLSVRPLNRLKIGISADYGINRDELQYVTSLNRQPDKRYILGSIDQKTLGLTFRADLNISPEFSVQYYGSPFVSKGSYSNFKYITTPTDKDLRDRFSLYQFSFKDESGIYLATGYMDIPDDRIDNPEFNFFQFRSNLVAKWEYRRGSYLYLVWSGDRTGSSASADEPLGRSFSHLKNAFTNNVFLVKFNYWFSL
ncbi:MAG TPA: DUF5916 domain-containing protein [Bacteroidales bacterium]|nr:DUF5916 domain-containing protein [Bacteroidales bacterium]